MSWKEKADRYNRVQKAIMSQYRFFMLRHPYTKSKGYPSVESAVESRPDYDAYVKQGFPFQTVIFAWYGENVE